MGRGGPALVVGEAVEREEQHDVDHGQQPQHRQHGLLRPPAALRPGGAARGRGQRCAGGRTLCAMFVKESTRVVGTVVCSSKRPMMKPSSRIRMLEPIAVIDGISERASG